MQLSVNNTPFANTVFHIIPYTSPKNIIQDSSLCPTNAVSCIRRPGFWFTAQAYTPQQSQSI